MESIENNQDKAFNTILLAILGITIVGCVVGVLATNYRHERSRADFFQQIHDRTAYRTECFDKAAKAMGSYDSGKVTGSPAYKACLVAEPNYPAL